MYLKYGEYFDCEDMKDSLQHDNVNFDSILKRVESNELIELHLIRYFIGNEGCMALSKRLSDVTKLHTLDLSLNAIEDSGCIALANALKINKSITALDLSFNMIAESGCNELCEALKINKNITTILFHEIEMDEHKSRVIELVNRNKRAKLFTALLGKNTNYSKSSFSVFESDYLCDLNLILIVLPQFF